MAMLFICSNSLAKTRHLQKHSGKYQHKTVKHVFSRQKKKDFFKNINQTIMPSLWKRWRQNLAQ